MIRLSRIGEIVGYPLHVLHVICERRPLVHGVVIVEVIEIKESVLYLPDSDIKRLIRLFLRIIRLGNLVDQQVATVSGSL